MTMELHQENPIKVETYTDQQATDEAVLLLTRKLRRLHPDTYRDLMQRIPEGARDALHLAELRADDLRNADRRDGITTREYRDMWATDETDDEPNQQ